MAEAKMFLFLKQIFGWGCSWIFLALRSRHFSFEGNLALALRLLSTYCTSYVSRGYIQILQFKSIWTRCKTNKTIRQNITEINERVDKRTCEIFQCPDHRFPPRFIFKKMFKTTPTLRLIQESNNFFFHEKEIFLPSVRKIPLLIFSCTLKTSILLRLLIFFLISSRIWFY